MPAWLLGSASISPQPTWELDVLRELSSQEGSKLVCHEPDYSKWLDPKQLRRMSRIMKMGAASALIALKNAGIEKPDAIITGTAYGCLEDTISFLSKLINDREEALNPTPFMQSTHNTIGSYVAFLLQCQGYNQTHTHGSFSFENTLLDAMMQLSEKSDQRILVGGVDEITDASHDIQSRFGAFRKQSKNNLDLFKQKEKGTLNGEGASWFLLTGEPQKDAIRVEGVETFYKSEPAPRIVEFLKRHDVTPSGIDLILTGKSGNTSTDATIDQLTTEYFNSSSTGVYKHLCGEYPVASAFAMWLATGIIKSGEIPAAVIEKNTNRKPETVLIYNQYFRDHHSLILLRKS